MLDEYLHGPFDPLFQDVKLVFRLLRYLLSLVQLMIHQNKDWHLKFSIIMNLLLFLYIIGFLLILLTRITILCSLLESLPFQCTYKSVRDNR
jgi:hypothetical protein